MLPGVKFIMAVWYEVCGSFAISWTHHGLLALLCGTLCGSEIACQLIRIGQGIVDGQAFSTGSGQDQYLRTADPGEYEFMLAFDGVMRGLSAQAVYGVPAEAHVEYEERYDPGHGAGPEITLDDGQYAGDHQDHQAQGQEIGHDISGQRQTPLRFLGWCASLKLRHWRAW